MMYSGLFGMGGPGMRPALGLGQFAAQPQPRQMAPGLGQFAQVGQPTGGMPMPQGMDPAQLAAIRQQAVQQMQKMPQRQVIPQMGMLQRMQGLR